MCASDHPTCAAPSQSAGTRGRALGFTVLELMLAMSVLAILASITLVLGRGIAERGRTAQAKAELAVLGAALEQYKQQYGDYPWTPGVSATPKTEGEGGDALEADDNESKFFNALAGALGPKLTGLRDAAGVPTMGRVLFEASRFSFESVDASGAALMPLIGAGATGDPELQEAVNAFLDPWGRRYQYRYRSTSAPGVWQSRGFALFSVGPDGVEDATVSNAGFVTVPPEADDLREGR